MAFKTRHSSNLHLIEIDEGRPTRSPLSLSYGGGLDSSAVIVGLKERKIRPDLILFADVGAEWPETYAYLPLMQDYLKVIGFPPITIVKSRPVKGKHGDYSNLEEECLSKKMLPSVAYGRNHSCAAKHKVKPQLDFIRQWPPAKLAWRYGLPVRQAIGFEDSVHEHARLNRFPSDKFFEAWAPLIEWGWNRDRCRIEIEKDPLLTELAKKHGISPVPRKSSCFFCPSMKAEEVKELAEKHPDLAERAMAIELAAAPNLRTVRGLWRRPRPRKGLPASFTEFITGVELQIGQNSTPGQKKSNVEKGIGFLDPPLFDGKGFF